MRPTRPFDVGPNAFRYLPGEMTSHRRAGGASFLHILLRRHCLTLIISVVDMI